MSENQFKGVVDMDQEQNDEIIDEQSEVQTEAQEKVQAKAVNKESIASKFYSYDDDTKHEADDRGKYLKSVREERGISLDAVSEATKIPLDALRAIEEGYKKRTLTPFYIKGFIKIYAAYLNVDTEDVIDGYAPEKLPQHIKFNYDDFDIGKWVSRYLTRKRKQQLVLICGGLLILFLLFKFIAFVANRPKKEKPPKQIENVQKPPQRVQAREVARSESSQNTSRSSSRASSTAVTTPAQPVVVNPPSGVGKAVMLTVRAKKKSWLRVKVDGQIVFQSTLREGGVETWSADKEIEIAGRNINELEFELNGKMIGSLGRSDRKANRVVITKDGLSVLK